MRSMSYRRTVFASLVMVAIVSSQAMGQLPVRLNEPTPIRQSQSDSRQIGTGVQRSVPQQIRKPHAVPSIANDAKKTRPFGWPLRLRLASFHASPTPVTQAQYNSPIKPTSTMGYPIQRTAIVPATGSAPAYECAVMCQCGVCAPPPGSTINAYFDAHIVNGEKARLVLYHYDFNNGPTKDPSQLNSAGRRKLAGLKGLLASSGHPLLVQRVDDDVVLSQARQAHVNSVLQAEHGLLGTQVVVRDFDLAGLKGPEAIDVDRSRQQITRASGNTQSGFRSTSASNVSNGQRLQAR